VTAIEDEAKIELNSKSSRLLILREEPYHNVDSIVLTAGALYDRRWSNVVFTHFCTMMTINTHLIR
jgi:hypothetical protein